MLIRLKQNIDFAERLKTIIPNEDLISDKITFSDPDMGAGQMINSIINIINQKNIKERIFGYSKNLFHTKIIEGNGDSSFGNFKYGEISKSVDYVVCFPEMKPKEFLHWVTKNMKSAKKGLIVVANIKPILSGKKLNDLSKLIIVPPVGNQTMQTPLGIYFFKKGAKTIKIYDEITGYDYEVNSIEDISQFSYDSMLFKVRDKIKEYCENHNNLSHIMHNTGWTNREYKKYRYVSTWPARRGHSIPRIDKRVWFSNDIYNPYSENGDVHTGKPKTKYPNTPTCKNCFSFEEKQSFYNLNNYSQTAWFKFCFSLGKYDQGQDIQNFRFIPVFDKEFKTNVTRELFKKELGLFEYEMKWIEKVMKPYM